MGSDSSPESLIAPSGMARNDWSPTQRSIQEFQERVRDRRDVTSSPVSGFVQNPPAFSPVISRPAGIRFGVCSQTRSFGL